MHPDLLGALARQRDRELLQRAPQPSAPWRRTFNAREALRAARARAGAALVDLGVRLMAMT
jgi:hypothetical protein